MEIHVFLENSKEFWNDEENMKYQTVHFEFCTGKPQKDIFAGVTGFWAYFLFYLHQENCCSQENAILWLTSEEFVADEENNKVTKWTVQNSSPI